MEVNRYLALTDGLASAGKASHRPSAALPAREVGARPADPVRESLAARVRAAAPPSRPVGGKLLRRVRASRGPMPETLWAEVRDDGRTVLANVPLLSAGLAYGDALMVEEPSDPGQPATVLGVAERGGNSTVLVALAASTEGPDPLAAVIAIAVAAERKGGLAALAIPSARHAEALGLLASGAADGKWSYSVAADRAGGA